MLNAAQRLEILRASLRKEAAAVQDARLALRDGFDVTGNLARIERAFHRMRSDADIAGVASIVKAALGIERAIKVHRSHAFQIPWELIDEAANTLLELAGLATLSKETRIDAQLVTRAHALGRKALQARGPKDLRPA